MATRARIGIQLKNDSILSIYSHWDGYPEWLGRILKTHYPTRQQVTELIDGGDVSSAWTNCGWNNETLPESGPLYYSTRGEDSPPRLDNDLVEYLLPDHGEEYHYLYRNGEWICYDMNKFNETKLPEIVSIPSGELVC